MRIATLVVVAVMATVVAVSAQTPFIAVYFDQYYSVEGVPPPPAANPCPGFGVPGELWIALVNANTVVVGAEFKVVYPTEITWFSDADTPPVKVGTTPVGLSVAWSLPQNGYEPVPLCKVAFWWNCQGCPTTNIPIVVVPHGGTGFLGYTDVYFNLHNAAGLTSLFCATIPAEETTWGQVKALYGE